MPLLSAAAVWQLKQSGTQQQRQQQELDGLSDAAKQRLSVSKCLYCLGELPVAPSQCLAS